jgi:hypothetical protein
MSDLLLPALFTVLVGDDPERRVATRTTEGHWRAFSDNAWWWHARETVHDVVEVIPDGTPVDRIVVLPEVGEVSVDQYGVYADGEMFGTEDDDTNWTLAVRNAASTLAVYRKAAAFVAARAAEPPLGGEARSSTYKPTEGYKPLEVGPTPETWGLRRPDGKCSTYGSREAALHALDVLSAPPNNEHDLALVLVDADPTPDPLAQARERLLAEVDAAGPDVVRLTVPLSDLRAALLAATEGGGDA